MRIKSSGGLVRALCCHSMLFLFDNTSAVSLKIVFRSRKLSESPKFSPLTLLHSNYNEVVFKNVIVKIYSHTLISNHKIDEIFISFGRL